ncbi:uncharacterized protein LOC143290824 isoform X2 [Babylonia areolata]|uniref:uncharacterized protein LOC143290824 isoform X2 n=1 Tax=Babylonia areolata TaxID=304850 RepID=UPI003FCF9E98
MSSRADGNATSCRLSSTAAEKQQTSTGPSDPPSESPNPSNQGKNSSKNSSSKGTAEEDCEFTIAADLTLYANPLRCLQKTARPASQHPAAGATEMIATDLVKYGSPLDDKPA